MIYRQNAEERAISMENKFQIDCSGEGFLKFVSAKCHYRLEWWLKKVPFVRTALKRGAQMNVTANNNGIIIYFVKQNAQ